MKSFSISIALGVMLTTHAFPVAAEIQMEILPLTTRPQDANFRLAGAFGFSVSFKDPDEYRLYATGGHNKKKWLLENTQTHDFFNDSFDGSAQTIGCYREEFMAGGAGPAYDPRMMDDRCIEAIGLFRKKINCQEPGCEFSGRWHAHPGIANISVYPVTYLWPNLNHEDWGIEDYTPVINKGDINAVSLLPADTNCNDGSPSCPPKTGWESTCFPHNPDAYATGASNPKVVELEYGDGMTSRWFMAFNTMQHWEGSIAPNPPGFNSRDIWRIAWAYSDDGASWTIHPQLIVRTTAEQGAFCGSGALATSLMIDEGYFYLTFTEPCGGKIFLARSAIDTDHTSIPGYVGAWEIAAFPITSQGEWTWKPISFAAPSSLASLNAAEIVSAPWGPIASGSCPVRQVAVARIFTSDAVPQSVYVALANNGSGELDLFSSSSMTRPFELESSVDLSDLSLTNGVAGEFGFTHYRNNNPNTPRLLAERVDFWIVQNFSNPEFPADGLSTVSVSRRTARLSGGVFPIFSDGFETGSTSAWSDAAP